VPSEHKRKIRGIIHDESTTGRTTFIEPEAVIDINNDVFVLVQEERKEIYRILKALSAFLRPYASGFQVFQDVLVQFDLIQAKAGLSLKLSAQKPIIKDLPTIKIVKGRHPLLLLKNAGLGNPTIPFSLTLGEKNRILVLSGPNAGGKSITMKSLGLLQLMAQSGLPVPADPLSEFGSFIDTQFKRAGGQGNTNISRQQQDKWVNQWLDSKGVSDNRARQVYWDRVNATYNRPNNPYADPRYRR
jgi:DNA mismatch repair protein MutS2